MKGTNCCVIGCNKRKKKKTGGEGNRSDSSGDEDEWTHKKDSIQEPFTGDYFIATHGQT